MLFSAEHGWGEIESLQVTNASIESGWQAGLNDNGEVFVVWDQVHGAGNRVWTNRYVPNEGWLGAEIIDSGVVQADSQPSVAVDNNGNAVAVWLDNGVWGNRFQ